MGFVVLFDSFSKYGIVNEFTIPITPSVFAYAKPPPSAREATRSVQFFNYVQTCKFVHITLGSLRRMTEGGKNYKIDELIGYYLIYLHYIINPTSPNLLKCFQLSTIKIKKLICLGLYY